MTQGQVAQYFVYFEGRDRRSIGNSVRMSSRRVYIRIEKGGDNRRGT